MVKNLLVLMLFAGLAFSGAYTSPALAQNANDTLHERAKKSGGKFVLIYKPKRSVTYPNVEELAKRSDLIVVGRTIGHRARLRTDGKLITKDFSVRVQEVIKGDIPANGSILVSLPGGAYRFPDGTNAFVIPMTYKQAEDRRIYVFFLKNKGVLSKGHEPLSESQGVFDLSTGKVQPATQIKEDPVGVKYREMAAAVFLEEIHKAVPRK